MVLYSKSDSYCAVIQLYILFTYWLNQLFDILCVVGLYQYFKLFYSSVALNLPLYQPTGYDSFFLPITTEILVYGLLTGVNSCSP